MSKYQQTTHHIMNLKVDKTHPQRNRDQSKDQEYRANNNKTSICTN